MVRLSELLQGVWWRDVDLKAGLLRIEGSDTKGKKARVFTLGDVPILRESIEAQHAKKREIEKRTGRIVTHLFFYHEGAKAGRQIRDFRHPWRKATKAAGLEGLFFHDLRRSAARNLVRAGVPIPLAQKMLGHETPSIFTRYCIIDETMLREGASKLAAFFEGQAEEPRKVAGTIGG